MLEDPINPAVPVSVPLPPVPVGEDVQEEFPIIDHDSIKTELQMEGEGDFTQVEEEEYEDSTILEEGTEHVVISNGQSELASSPANFDQHNHFDHFDQYMSKVGGGTFSCNICPYVKTKTLVNCKLFSYFIEFGHHTSPRPCMIFLLLILI